LSILFIPHATIGFKTFQKRLKSEVW